MNAHISIDHNWHIWLSASTLAGVTGSAGIYPIGNTSINVTEAIRRIVREELERQRTDAPPAPQEREGGK